MTNTRAGAMDPAGGIIIGKIFGLGYNPAPVFSSTSVSRQ